MTTPNTDLPADKPIQLVENLQQAVVVSYCLYNSHSLEQLALHHKVSLFRFLEILEEPESKRLIAQLTNAQAQRQLFLAADVRHSSQVAILAKLRTDPTSAESLRLASTVLRTTKLPTAPRSSAEPIAQGQPQTTVVKSEGTPKPASIATPHQSPNPQVQTAPNPTSGTVVDPNAATNQPTPSSTLQSKDGTSQTAASPSSDVATPIQTSPTLTTQPAPPAQEEPHQRLEKAA